MRSLEPPDCTQCNATMTWDGDLPDSAEDLLCDPCVRAMRLELKDRVAELESERGWLIHEIKWAVDGKSTWALESVLRVAGATAASVSGAASGVASQHTQHSGAKLDARTSEAVRAPRTLAEKAAQSLREHDARTNEASIDYASLRASSHDALVERNIALAKENAELRQRPETALPISTADPHGVKHCADCGDIRWCCKASCQRARRMTIDECIRAADAGDRECITGCHGRLQALHDSAAPQTGSTPR